MEELNFKIKVNNGNVSVDSYINETHVNECKILINKTHDTWTISSWYTVKEYNNKGYGTKTLQEALYRMKELYGLPENIEYVWNGANKYVFDWMNKHFGAISKCPIAIQKYSFDDDWESHIYVLNRDKFINYFNLNKPLYKDIDDIERED